MVDSYTARADGPIGERTNRRLWLTPLVVGVISVAAGLAVLSTPWTLGQLAFFAAFLFMFRGISVALSAAEGRTPTWLGVIAGVCGVIAGFWLLVWPGPSLLVLAVFIGAWLTVSGIVNTVGAVVGRREIPHWWLVLIVGIIEVLLGMWAMRRPVFSLALAVTVIGFWMILTGGLYCAIAMEVRRAARDAEPLSAPYDAGGRAPVAEPTGTRA